MSKPLNTNFNILAPAPIDKRMQVATFALLDAIPVKYNLMITQVVDEDKEYKYYASTNTWVEHNVSNTWGSITGDITTQNDLMARFNLYALVGHTHPQQPPLAHTHVEAEITDLDKYTKAEVDALVQQVNKQDTSHISGLELSIDTPTTFKIASGVLTKNVWVSGIPYTAPTAYNIEIPEITGIIPTYLATHAVSYIGILYNQNLETYSVVQSSSAFSASARRSVVPIGEVYHPDNTTIDRVSIRVEHGMNPLNQLYDLFGALGPIKISGNEILSNGANLTLAKNVGVMLDKGTSSDTSNPHIKTLPGIFGLEVEYQTQSSTEGVSSVNLLPNFWDDAGVITPLTTDYWSVQRVIYTSSKYIIQYGQAEYSSLEKAETLFETENFVKNPDLLGIGLILGYIILKQGTSDLSDPTQAKIIQSDKFGEHPVLGGAGADTNLQVAYDNSVTPQIITTPALGAVTIRNGQDFDAEVIYKIQNKAGTDTFKVKGNGEIEGYSGSFLSHVTVANDPYAPSWENSFQVPTKNSIFNKIESLDFLRNIVEDLSPQFGAQVDAQGNNIINVDDIIANSFIKTGGISSEFLKADGTIDSTIYENTTNKGIANGYTPLDSGSKVPIAYLPDSVVGQVEYQGTWNATTNTPDVGDPTLSKGHYYVASTSGTYLTVDYQAGDWIISNGVDWEKVDNTDAVTSVFGRIGAIVANSGDYTFAQIGSKPTTIAGYGITNAYTKTEADNKYLLNTTDTFTGTLSVVGNIETQNLELTSTNPFILGNTTTGVLYISGTSSILNSSGIKLYGATHASRAGDLEFTSDGSQVGAWDDSANAWNFNGAIIGTGGNITGGSFIKSGGLSTQFLKADGSIDSTAYLPSTTYSAADVLTKIKTVDGSGSGLDADLLRGVHWGNVNTDIVTSSEIYITGQPASGESVGLYLSPTSVDLADRAKVGYHNSGYLELRPRNGFNSVFSRGNVGIGTTTPNDKLEISGVGQGLRLFSNFGSEGESNTELNKIFFAKHVTGGIQESIKIYNVGTFAETAYSASDLRFAFAPSSGGSVIDKITFKWNGNVGIGTTSPAHKLDVSGTGRFTGEVRMATNSRIIGTGTGTANVSYLSFYESNGAIIQGYIGFDSSSNSNLIIRNGVSSKYLVLQASGKLTYNGDVTATDFILSSDRRLKKNIKNYKVKPIEIDLKNYKLKADETNKDRIGVIAQELEKKHPEFIETNAEGYKSVSYIQLLLAKVAELDKRIKELEK